MNARFVPTIGGIVLVALLAACGNTARTNGGTFNPSGSTDHADSTSGADSGSDSGSGPKTALAPSAMSAAQLRESVLARYREYQQAYQKAYETNDPSGLLAVTMDPLLGIVTKDIKRTKAKGQIWRFYNALNPEIQGRSKDATTVVVLDCVRTTGAYVFSAKTGKRISAHEGSTKFYQAVVKFADGTWKVSDAKWGNKC